jgi:hypothetical protein
MENIWMAMTNAPAYLPIRAAIRAGDTITALGLIFVTGASTVSHLVENHRGCQGLGISV